MFSRRGLILDLDDTLYPRARFVRSGFAAVAKMVEVEHGIGAEDAFATLARAHEMGAAGRELQTLCARYRLPETVVPRGVEVIRAHRPAVWLSQAAIDTLARLREDGWRLALLTNGLPLTQAAKVEALGLADRVDHVIFAEEHGPGGKPAASTFQEALRRLGVTSARCVCVGDDPVRDIEGARSVGLATIRIARGTGPSPALEADCVIRSLDELPSVAAMLLQRVTADAA